MDSSRYGSYSDGRSNGRRGSRSDGMPDRAAIIVRFVHVGQPREEGTQGSK